MIIIIIGLTTLKALDLYQFDGVYEYEGSLDNDEEIFVEKLFKYNFYIYDGVTTFELDFTKVDAYIEHEIIKYTQEGDRKTTVTRHNIRKCNSSDFNKTDFERSLWKNMQQTP